jgi:hypothetical protein
MNHSIAEIRAASTRNSASEQHEINVANANPSTRPLSMPKYPALRRSLRGRTIKCFISAGMSVLVFSGVALSFIVGTTGSAKAASAGPQGAAIRA